MLSALLGIFKENPWVIGGFPLQRASYTELWCFVFVVLNKLLNNSRSAGDETNYNKLRHMGCPVNIPAHMFVVFWLYLNAFRILVKYTTFIWIVSSALMMTSSNRNIFRVTGHLCGEFTGEFPAQRPVTRSFDIFFDLRLNKWLSKQSWGWYFAMPLRPLWRHRIGGNRIIVSMPVK